MSHVVVGGGISGLVAALLQLRRGQRDVVLIEREAEVGGLLRSFDYGELGRWDYGMHTMLDSGIPELDELLFGLLPAHEWQVLEGAQRDLAGVYVAGRLQAHTPYIDLRDRAAEDLDRYRAGFFRVLNDVSPIDEANALAYVTSRFGAAIASEALAPAIAKIYRRPAEEMDAMATLFTPMDRVVLFDETPFLDLMRSDAIRGRLAYPEQRRLPPSHSAGRRGYYPRGYGMYRVVEALRDEIEGRGGKILTGTQVTRIETYGDRVKGVAGPDWRLETEDLCWTTGLPPLALLLGCMPPGLRNDPPLRTVVVNLLLDRPLAVGDLYYFFCYEPGLDTYRVTNFSAYCDGAPRAGGYPISVELLVDPARDSFNAVKELDRMNVLAPGTRVLMQRVEPLAAGFPLASLSNIQGLTAIREAISARHLENLMVSGVLARPGLFFQADVLRFTHASLTERSLAR